jgi:hypothetical protein
LIYPIKICSAETPTQTTYSKHKSKTTNRSLDKNWENNKAESYTRYPGKNSNAKKGSR